MASAPQLAIFPMKYVNITQKWGSGTHRYGYPIDLAGKDFRIDSFYAPFDGKVKKIWPAGNTVWLESLGPVMWANGKLDYATVNMTHDNSVSDLKVGQIIKQGQVFYQEGTAGRTTGNHVHFECAKGRFTGSGWYAAATGQWVINNPVKPTDLLTLTKNNVVIQTLGLQFKTQEENEMVDEATLSCMYRLYLGTGITAYGRAHRLGKQTAEQVQKDMIASKEYKAIVAQAKKGLVPLANLPVEIRKELGQ